MSGIYIKGMEMPTSCMDCKFKGFDRAGGRGNLCTLNESITFHAVLDGLDVKFVRMGDCPLIPVPDHGRLIDADDVRNEIDAARPGRSYEDAWALTIVDNAVTVIAADKTDKEKK